MAIKLVARKVHPLSRQQYAVVMAYGDGYRYQEIADKLGLAYHTVKRHAEEARAKLGVDSLAEAYRQIRRMQRDNT